MKLKFSQFLDRGGRDYMEDFSFSHIEERNGQFIFGIFGVFDGHGGSEAAEFAQKTLKDELIKMDKFWSNDNLEVLESIKMVYSKLQNLMWIEREKWIRTISGYKSTAGSTATIAIIRNGILYSGHVGDSGIVLLHTNSSNVLQSSNLTTEHKPDNPIEKQRIEQSGGSLHRKFGIERVVWNRKRLCDNYNGIDKIPFLAVARSLGDLWSYDFNTDQYHVSPEPDVQYLSLDANSHRAIIIGSDGLWNVVSLDISAKIVSLSHQTNKDPARLLVRYCLNKWKEKNVKADNISAIVITFHFESDSTISHKLESLKSDCLPLYQELLFHNILDDSDECSTNINVCVLDNVVDATVFRCTPTQQESIGSSDVDLLKRFLKHHPDLSESVNEWPDQFWSLLVHALHTNLGLVSFSKIMYHIDSCDLTELSNTLTAFPWSICFRQLVCEPQSSLCQSLPMYNQIHKYLINQPLLSPFWIDFYTNTIDHNPYSQYKDIDTMKTTLIRTWDEISLWLMLHVPTGFLDIGTNKAVTDYRQYCAYTHNREQVRLEAIDESETRSIEPVVSCDTTKMCALSLRKASTFSESGKLLNAMRSHDESIEVPPVFQCYQLRRSASHNVNHSSSASLFESSSSTPVLSVSPDSGRSTSASPASHHEPISHPFRVQSNNRFVSRLPVKRQSPMPSPTATKIILISKPDGNTSPKKIVKKFGLSRQKRFML